MCIYGLNVLQMIKWSTLYHKVWESHLWKPLFN